MEGEASSSWRSRLVVSVDQVFSSGTDSEILKIENAALSLMGCEDFPTADVIRTGEFALRVVMQSISSILIVFCMVGDLQWPITKDAPVLRVGRQSFAFAMPGLLCGLQFTESCCQDQFDILARLFRKFSYFEDHSQRATGIEFSVPESRPGFWSASQPMIELITEPLLKRIGSVVCKAPSFKNGMNEGLLKIIRMSGVTKLITKGVLVGGIDQDHIDIFDTRPRPDGSKDPKSARAFPTIFLFSDLVEAVEAIRIIASGKFRPLQTCHPTWTPLQGVKLWNINKKGLMLLLNALVSSAAIQNGEVVDVEEKACRTKRLNFDAMGEDAKMEGEAATEEKAKSYEAMEEEGSDSEEVEDEVTSIIREIRFPIMAGSGKNGRGGQKPRKNSREGSVSMEEVGD